MEPPSFVFLAGASLVCGGCGKGPWEAYHTPLPVLGDVRVTLCDSVEMVRRDDMDPNIFFVLFENGYVPIGYTEFNGTENYLDEPAIAAEARKSGACVCYYGARYSHTESGLDLASGLPAGASGTVSAPASPLQLGERKRDMFDYLAVYAAKDVTSHFLGILAAVAPEAYRKKLQTETGLIVLAVRKGSAADGAGIVRGDVLVSFGGKPLTREIVEGGAPSRGEAVPVTLYREGSLRDVRVAVP